jgi:Mrp family chromosome partitioning ATPase
MKSKVDIWRVSFLTLTVLAALGAVALQSYGPSSEPGYAVSALLRSELLGTHIPFEALKIESEKPEFQDRFQNRVLIEDSDVSDTSVFRVLLTTEDEFRGRELLTEVQVELGSSLKALATRGSDRQLEELGKIKPPETERPSPESQPQLAPVFQADEHSKALRLGDEIKALEGYLRGQSPEPKWLERRLDGKALDTSRENLIEAKMQLQKLSSIYGNNNQAVKKQKKLVDFAGKAFKEEKRHHAGYLLESYRAEFEDIRSKAELRVEQNAKRIAESKKAKPPAAVDELEDANPLVSSTSVELQEERALLLKKAEVHVVGEPVITRPKSDTYWFSVLLWLASGGFMLVALFRPTPSSEPNPTTTIPSPRVPRPVSPTPISNDPSETDPFLMSVLQSIEKEIRRPCRRLLVLGDSRNPGRASASARLARSVSASGRVVRLVDFDFEQRTLSSNLGNRETVGVSDFLVTGAPVDEFLASVSGTRIEFAPAGRQRFVSTEPDPGALARLLQPREKGLLVVDAGFTSPLHLVIKHLDAVLCVTQAGKKWGAREQEVLLAIRHAELPIWGLVQGDQQLYPFT